jgi:hypothetical protein
VKILLHKICILIRIDIKWQVPVAVILANLGSWEQEDQSKVRGQPRQKVCKTPITTSSWVAHTCHFSYVGDWDQHGQEIMRPHLNRKKSWAWCRIPVTLLILGSIKIPHL